MVYIIGKTFPNQAQIQGRIDSKAFDGVEMFVMDDIIENPQKYQEMVKLARDKFPIVNFETFYAVNALGGKKTFGLIDERQEVRDRSRALFEATIRLNNERGNVNTHFVGRHLVLNPDKINKNPFSQEEQIQETGEYLAPFKRDVTLENVITFNSEPGGDEGPVLYNVGSDMDDFVEIYNRFGIPITLDTAHLAINLEHYWRHRERKGISDINGRVDTSVLKSKGNNYRISLTEGQSLLQTKMWDSCCYCSHDVDKMTSPPSGHEYLIMKEWMSEVSKLPRGAIKNVHFINGKVDDNDEYSDGYVDFSAQDGRLLNLGDVLSYLTSGQCVFQIVPEVVDGLYATPEAPADYNKVPYMVKLANTLREKLSA